MTLADLNQLVKMFESIEAQPKSLAAAPGDQIEGSAGGKHETHTFAEWYQIGRLARVQYLFDSATHKDPKWRQAWLQLDRQLMALHYGAIEKPGNVHDQGLIDQFTLLVGRYKLNPKLYPGGSGALTQHDRDQIAALCTKYPLLARELLRRNPAGSPTTDDWTSGLMKFCFRSGLSVEVFVEAPHETDELMKAHLDKRIGTIDPAFLKFIQFEGRRVVALKFDGADRPVQGAHKQREVPLSNCLNPAAADCMVNVASIYAEFRKKTAGYGPYEVVADRGISLWNTIELGVDNPATGEFTPLNVTQPDWIQKIPHEETIQWHELAGLYPGQRICQAGEYGFVVRANREKANRDVMSNHAFFDVLAPVPGSHGQQYHRYSFGFQPKELPASDWQRFLFLQETKPANLHGLDEGHYLSNRQHAGLFIAMNPAEYAVLEERLGAFLTKGRQGQKYFQAMNKNCGYFVQGIFDKTIGHTRFYGPLQAMVEQAVPEWDAAKRKQIFKLMTKGLNDDALEELAETLTQKITETNDIPKVQALLDLCLEMLSTFKPAGEDYEDLDIEQLYQRQPEHAQAILKEGLKELLKITVASQQFYKTSLFDAEMSHPIFKFVYNGIKSVRWEALRLFLLKVLLFVVFASWRGYTFVDANGQARTRRARNGLLSDRAMLNLPAVLFDRPALHAAREQQVAQILQRIAPPEPAPLDDGAGDDQDEAGQGATVNALLVEQPVY